jgi:hypothetical protein
MEAMAQKPAGLQVQQATMIELVINLKTARRLASQSRNALGHCRRSDPVTGWIAVRAGAPALFSQSPALAVRRAIGARELDPQVTRHAEYRSA